MALRSDKEMQDLVTNFAERVGPLESWSDAALEKKLAWIYHLHIALTQELAERQAQRCGAGETMQEAP